MKSEEYVISYYKNYIYINSVRNILQATSMCKLVNYFLLKLGLLRVKAKFYLKCNVCGE